MSRSSTMPRNLAQERGSSAGSLALYLQICLPLDGARAFLSDAGVRSVELHTSVVVRVEHVLDVSARAAEVHVITADALDEARRGPHADAPRISRIGGADDTPAVASTPGSCLGLRHPQFEAAHSRVPLESLLASDLPKVLAAPFQRRFGVQIDQPAMDRKH